MGYRYCGGEGQRERGHMKMRTVNQLTQEGDLIVQPSIEI